jgi:hypothetical protein
MSSRLEAYSTNLRECGAYLCMSVQYPKPRNERFMTSRERVIVQTLLLTTLSDFDDTGFVHLNLKVLNCVCPGTIGTYELRLLELLRCKGSRREAHERWEASHCIAACFFQSLPQ